MTKQNLQAVIDTAHNIYCNLRDDMGNKTYFEVTISMTSKTQSTLYFNVKDFYFTICQKHIVMERKSNNETTSIVLDELLRVKFVIDLDL